MTTIQTRFISILFFIRTKTSMSLVEEFNMWMIWSVVLMNMSVEYWSIFDVFVTSSTRTELWKSFINEFAMKNFLKNHMMIELNIRCFCESVNENNYVKIFFNCVFKNTLRFNHISINIEFVFFVNRAHATLIWNKKNRLSVLTDHIFYVRRQVDERENLILNSKFAR